MREHAQNRTRTHSMNDWFLVIFFLAASVYNSQIYFIRLLMILLLLMLPAMLFFSRRIYKFENHIFHYMLVSSLWVAYFIFWFVRNFDDFEFNFSGPNVEMMTPVLYISILYTLPVIANYDLSRLKWSVKKFLLLYTCFLILDMFARIALAPGCFMNYYCRFEAKTVGYFSTTNALATSLVAVFIACIIAYILKMRSKWVFSFILLSSMARAAIIAAIIASVVYQVLRTSKVKRVLVICAFVAVSLFVLIIDPLNFKGDGSLLSKIDFFLSAFTLLYKASGEQIFFGFGANFESVTETLGVNGWSPHVPALKGLLYFGLVGVLLHIYTLYGVARLHRFMIVPVLAFFVLGLAGAPLFFPTFLVSYAILRLS